jgi:hypothetical protein
MSELNGDFRMRGSMLASPRCPGMSPGFTAMV